MNSLPKLIIIIGVILIMIGLGMKFINLGRLPGDIVIKKENTTFYFPIVTSVVLSIVLSAVFYIIGRFK